MKRDSLDEALRRKLHDAEAGLPFRRGRRCSAACNCMRMRILPSVSLCSVRGAVMPPPQSSCSASGWAFGGFSARTRGVRNLWPKRWRCRFPFPVAIPPRMTAPAFNDTALNRIMKSARSVRLIRSPFESIDCAPRQSERRRQVPRPAIRRRLGIIRTTRLRPEAICRRNRIGPQRPPPTES